MTTIKATCPFCGEDDLTAQDIVLKIEAKTETNSDLRGSHSGGGRVAGLEAAGLLLQA